MWTRKYQILFIFIIKGFRTIVFIFIVIAATFRPICPPAFFRRLSNSRTFMELRTTSFIETTGVACSDSVSHNRVQVLSIPVLLLACSEDWTCNLQIIVSLEVYRTNAYNRYAMCAAGQFRVNFYFTENQHWWRIVEFADSIPSWEVRLPSKNYPENDTKLHLMVGLLFRRPEECTLSLHCHYSQVHFNPE